jgi:hypothetical protein
MPFSIVNKGEGWFWCSLLEGNELIGPFPSQEEAEKDARASLGIEALSPADRARLSWSIAVGTCESDCSENGAEAGDSAGLAHGPAGGAAVGAPASTAAAPCS